MKKFLAAIILLWASVASAQFNGCRVGFCPGNIFSGGATPVFSAPQVLLSDGDSQSLSTISASDQSACEASYIVSSKIKVLNFTNNWVTYTPGTITGYSIYSGNIVSCGTETGFINSWKSAYPNDELYIIKSSAPGSYQTIGAPTVNGFSITATGGANPCFGCTYTQISPTLIGNNTVITGTGVPAGTYIPFSNFITTVGSQAYTGVSGFGPTAITQYVGTSSWSVTQGLIYPGNSAQVNNGVRAKIVAGLALLSSPNVIVHIHDVGTNDVGLTGVAQATMQTELSNYRTTNISDLGVSYASSKMIITRSTTGQVSSINVRAAETAFRNQTTIFMLDTDAYTKWDGTHWNLAAQLDMGILSFQIFQGTYQGI